MTTPSSPAPRKKPSSPNRTSRRQARAEEAARKARQKRLMSLLAVVLVVAIVGVSGFAYWTSKDDSPSELVASPMALSAIPQSGMTIGMTDAPITVIEYADFQCPFCANFALQMEPQLVQNYVATGQVRFEFQPMPILSSLALDDPANESVRAAEAGICASDQGKFWDFYSLLYTKQSGENIGTFTLDKLIGYAQEGGLDVPTFTSCMNNRTHLQEVLNSRQQGINAGVSGTPTFFVNGTKVVGYGKLEETIQATIDAKS
ncbi:MAG: thioredoxin domain-containing protein [Thermomicrobiales bacterium]